MVALPSLAFFKTKKFLIPAGIVALLIAVGAGTFFYLKHQTNTLVNTAVTGANQKATNATLQQAQEISDAKAAQDQQTIRIIVQTTKDYANVQQRIDHAPVEQRQAPVPPLVIDTLNELDRLRQARDADGVAATQVPQG
jgi:hypothetical protein